MEYVAVIGCFWLASRFYRLLTDSSIICYIAGKVVLLGRMTGTVSLVAVINGMLRSIDKKNPGGY